MEHTTIHDLLTSTMDRVRTLVDANTIIGTPIQTGDTTLIPISKLSFGFGCGGGDFGAKGGKATAPTTNTGGGGGGAKLDPVAFLIIRGDSVKLLPVNPPTNSVDRIVEAVPEVLDKITDFIDRQQEKMAEAKEKKDFAE